MDDSIEWRPPFEEMEFEFLEVSLVEVPIGWSFPLDSHINFFLNFHPSARIPLDTYFLRGSWSNSLNRHKEFSIVAISLFHDEDIG